MSTSQPRLSRIERAVRAAHANSDNVLRQAELQRFKRHLKYVRHSPVGRVSVSKVLGLEG